MRVICTYENLKKGLSSVSRVSSGSVTLPILNNVLLQTDQGMLRLSATNLEIGENTWIRCKVEEEGGVTVPSRVFGDLVNNLPNGNISLTLENNQLLVESFGFKTKIKGLNADEFPLIPIIENQEPVLLPTKEIKEAVSQVVFATANSETQPEISGILFAFEEKGLKLVGTDRYRLAEKFMKLAVPAELQDKQIIMPSRTLQELTKTISGNEKEPVKLFISQNQIMFKTDETEIISRLIDGQYPDYKQIIPNEFLTEIDVSVPELSVAMRTAGIFTHTGNNVTLQYSEPDVLQVASVSGDIGESQARVQAVVSGNEGKIIFNHKYILDCLGALSSAGVKQVTFKLINDNSPAVLISKELPGYTYLVMPIKV